MFSKELFDKKERILLWTLLLISGALVVESVLLFMI